MSFIAFVIGLAATLALGLLTPRVLTSVLARRSSDASRPIPQWDDVLAIEQRGGSTIGRLEQIFFFLAIWLAQPIGIAGWLAFKLGSKWQVWQHIVRVPDDVPSADSVENLRFRLVWAARTLQRFLVGTLYNLICGASGVAVARFLSPS